MTERFRRWLAALDAPTRRFLAGLALVTAVALAFRLSLLGSIAARNPDGGDPRLCPLEGSWFPAFKTNAG